MKPNIEDVKQYWDRRPCNIRHSKSVIGTKQYFDEVEKRKYKVEPHIPAFADFEKWKQKSVLEIGCGIGTDAVNFARAGAYYYGIDCSKESIKLTIERFKVYELSGQFEINDAENFSYNILQRKFDLVYSFGVIHHTPNPKLIVSNVKKVLSDDGEFRLMLYAKNSWKNAMILSGLDQPEAQNGCPIAKTYSNEEVHSLLKDFEIIEIKQEHIFPYVIEKYVNHEYEFQPWFKAMPTDMFKALEKSLGWHLLIRCKRRK